MASSTNVTQILSPDAKNGQHRQQPESQHPQGLVQVDLSNMIGRIKPKPVCLDKTLKLQSNSCEEISKFVFDSNTNADSAPNNRDTSQEQVSVVSSGSSTEGETPSEKSSNSLPPYVADGSFSHRKTESEKINLKVKTQTISRNGRQTQRWYTDPATHTLYRMTTGCIPVLKDGKIMFCSASRKPEWILPKGGWEKDEAMEESAIRETFEEGGVFGIIGPSLTEIKFETRKGKKRRMEFEQVQQQRKAQQKAQEECSSSSSPKASLPDDEAMAPPMPMKSRVVSSSEDGKKLTETALQGLNSSNHGQQQYQSRQPSDGDNVSVASETSLSHAHVKMTLFPLYVTEVKESWPEQGRFRKVVDIDEAIRISESRPYFQQALKELKERNLHVCHELQPTTNSTTNNITTSNTNTTAAADDKET